MRQATQAPHYPLIILHRILTYVGTWVPKKIFPLASANISHVLIMYSINFHIKCNSVFKNQKDNDNCKENKALFDF